jgi:hypothetical protein
MPQFRPIARKELIRYLREAGFEVPYSEKNINICVKVHSRFSFPILIREISVGAY